ncbi:MAG: hypothetical protein LBO04_07875 [Spirochaetaceae bacterium]|jgi:hypothetical protein|nr:hypothetical protein [Spirochaetaceae bacterium]
MRKKNRYIRVILPEPQTEKKLCPYCKSGNGEKKEIYDSREDALNRAEYINIERGMNLTVYMCPYKTGWHLTKGKADIEPDLAPVPILPPPGSRVDWVVENDGDVPVWDEKPPAPPPAKPPIPIRRVEARENGGNVSREGRVVEIVKTVSIEDTFKISLDSPFSASLAKEFLDDEYQQITIHTGPGGAGRTDSYTALVKKTLMQKYKIKKNSSVKIIVSGKCINKKTVWRCVSIIPYP